MAYQPIQLPNGMVLRNWDRLSDTVGDIQAQRQRQAEADRQFGLQEKQFAAQQTQQQETKARQQKLDAQGAYAKAMELAQAGDIQGAKLLLNHFGFKANEVMNPAMQPDSGPVNPFANDPAPVQGGSAVPDGVENAQRMRLPAMPTNTLDAAAAEEAGPVGPQMTPGEAKYREQLQKQKAHNYAAATATLGRPPRNMAPPQMAGPQTGIAYTDPVSGQRGFLDPMAQQRQKMALRQQNADTFMRVAEQAPPEMRPYLMELRPFVEQSPEPIAPTVLVQHVRQRMSDEAEARAKKEQARLAEQRRLEDHEDSWKKLEYVQWKMDARNAASNRAVARRQDEKAPTEAQSKYAILGSQMQREIETIQGLPPLDDEALAKIQENELRTDAADNAGSGMISSVLVSGARKLGAVPKSKYEGLTAQQQQVANAWDALSENFIRLKTGAGMTVEEARASVTKYQPRPGESAEAKQAKLQRLAGVIEDMMSQAGKAADRLPGRAAAPKGPKALHPSIEKEIDELYELQKKVGGR